MRGGERDVGQCLRELEPVRRYGQGDEENADEDRPPAGFDDLIVDTVARAPDELAEGSDDDALGYPREDGADCDDDDRL